MSKFLRMTLVYSCCILLAAPCLAASGGGSPNKDYFEKILNSVCNTSDCSRQWQPNNPENARELLTTASYLFYNVSREKVEKYNAPLKKMGIEGVLFIPSQIVENTLCQYYGYDIARHPALQKAAQELAPHGFYTVSASDGGIDDYTIDRMEIQKNGVLRVNGKIMDETPFTAYFGQSGCGGKKHWVLLRVVDQSVEAGADYTNQLD